MEPNPRQSGSQSQSAARQLGIGVHAGLGRVPTLPTELIVEIVKHLRGCKPALMVCCLLSTQWNACARPYLHHTAHLRHLTDLARWQDLVDLSPDIGQRLLRRIEIVTPAPSAPVLKGIAAGDHILTREEWQAWDAFWKYQPVSSTTS